MLKWLWDLFFGGRDRATGAKRSPLWRSVRAAHLEKEPRCIACGSGSNLSVHHVIPYHVRPDLELDGDNLITLCEGGPVNCHLLWGHWRKWRSFNPEVRLTCSKIRTLMYRAYRDQLEVTPKGVTEDEFR